jgi:hypothetical protein
MILIPKSKTRNGEWGLGMKGMGQRRWKVPKGDPIRRESYPHPINKNKIK